MVETSGLENRQAVKVSRVRIPPPPHITLRPDAFKHWVDYVIPDGGDSKRLPAILKKMATTCTEHVMFESLPLRIRKTTTIR